MPTGYTAPIKDGITFKKFAMDCARAFGACIDMRDEPSDALIPEEFKPTLYYEESIKKTEIEFLRIEKMSDKDAEKEANLDYNNALISREKRIQEKNDLRAKYEAMLKEVRAWIPPSSDHVAFKDFMIQQIISSIDFDCSLIYDLDHSPVKLTGKEWRMARLHSMNDSLLYDRKEDKKEKERCAERTQWVKQLRISLGV